MSENKIQYLVIGSYAVGYHGYPRATVDLDVWVAINEDNAEKLMAAMKIFGFADANLNKVFFLKENQIIRMGVPPFRIEILTTISGISFEDCFLRRIEDEIDGVKVNIICLDDLKKNKKAAGRLKDLADLENLP